MWTCDKSLSPGPYHPCSPYLKAFFFSLTTSWSLGLRLPFSCLRALALDTAGEGQPQLLADGQQMA